MKWRQEKLDNPSSGEREIAIRNSPEVNPQRHLKLLQLGSDRAYFLDSEKNIWYFDIDNALWREATREDAERLRTDPNEYLQTMLGPQPEQTEFHDIEDASLHVLKMHFKSDVQATEDVSSLFGKSVTGGELGEEMRSDVQRSRRIVECIEKIESEPDPAQKVSLKKDLGQLLKRLNVEEV